MAVGRTPEERFFEIINQMQERINKLEARPLQVPIVDVDPGASYAGNIWAFQDGRIHIRLTDGSIQELQGSASSGPLTGVLKPTAPPQPTVQRAEWSAVWSQAYRDAGGFTGGDAETLYYGNDGTAPNGRQTSLVGFDYSSIQTTLSGAVINKVEIYLYNKDTYYAAGGTVYFGLHNSATKPVGVVGLGADLLSSGSVQRSTGAYHTVSNQFGSWLRDNLAKGIMLQAPNDSLSFYGSASGVGDGPPVPRIRITFTK